MSEEFYRKRVEEMIARMNCEQLRLIYALLCGWARKGGDTK